MKIWLGIKMLKICLNTKISEIHFSQKISIKKKSLKNLLNLETSNLNLIKLRFRKTLTLKYIILGSVILNQNKD